MITKYIITRNKHKSIVYNYNYCYYHNYYYYYYYSHYHYYYHHHYHHTIMPHFTDAVINVASNKPVYSNPSGTNFNRVAVGGDMHIAAYTDNKNIPFIVVDLGSQYEIEFVSIGIERPGKPTETVCSLKTEMPFVKYVCCILNDWITDMYQGLFIWPHLDSSCSSFLKLQPNS